MLFVVLAFECVVDKKIDLISLIIHSDPSTPSLFSGLQSNVNWFLIKILTMHFHVFKKILNNGDD